MADARAPAALPRAMQPATVGRTFSASKPAQAAVHQCPAKPTQPCDTQKLIVKDSLSARKVQTTKKRVLEPIPAGTPAWLREALGRHDLVLELIADYVTSSGDPPMKKVSLEITSYATGRCQLALHPLLTQEAIRGATANDTKRWSSTTAPAQVLLAKSFFLDTHFEGFFLAPFWSFDAVKELLVTARSCGIRRGGDGTPNADLSCLVRIYRNDLYTLTLKIPAFGALTSSATAGVNLRGQHVAKRDVSGSVGGMKVGEYSQGTVRDSRGTHYTETKVGGSEGPGQYHSLTEKVGTQRGQAFLEEKESIQQRRGPVFRTTTESDSTEKGRKTITGSELATCAPVISFKRNGQELDFTGFIASLVDVWVRIKKSWDELLEWVPAVGWSVKFTLSLFEGSIIGKWGNSYALAPPATSDRYLAIRTFYEIAVALDVFNVKLEGSFGINISAPGIIDKLLTVKTFELILQLKGTISSKASIHKTLKSTEKLTGAKITSDGSVDVLGQARVTVTGVTADARAGMTGGLVFEGELKCSFTTSMHVAGEFKRKKVTVYAQFTNPITGRTQKVQKDIWDEKTIWKGNLPGTKREARKPAPKAARR